MADKTKIEWTEATWNPTTGCSKVSPGCKNCYAEREWVRLSANPETVYYRRNFNEVATHADRLNQPLRWTKSRLIFVNSMSDLFHGDIPLSFIQEVWLTMAFARARGHRFQILTKRADRMPDVLNQIDQEFIKAVYESAPVDMPPWEWPLPNVWLGASVEDQKRADERIPFLLRTPAAVRFLSCEPLLGSVDLLHTVPCGYYCSEEHGHIDHSLNGLHWVIVGGESGPNARPTHPEWIRGLRDQCQAAQVPFFFKQWGEHVPAYMVENSSAYPWEIISKSGESVAKMDGQLMCRVGKKFAGRVLDGRTWEEYPNA